MAGRPEGSLPQLGRAGRLVTLAVGVAVALVVGANAVRHEREMREDRVRVELASMASRLGADVTAATQQVRSARSYLTGSEFVSPLEFAAFFDDLAPSADPPWRALAAAIVAEEDGPGPWEAYLVENADEYEQLHYPPVPDLAERDAAARIRAPVLLVEPASSRPRVFGFDMASEADRRATIAAAAESGSIRVSPPVVLSQDQPGGPESLLLIAPFPAEALGASPGSTGVVALSITPSSLLARAAEAARGDARYRADIVDADGTEVLSVSSEAHGIDGFAEPGFRVVRPATIEVPIVDHTVRLQWQPGGADAVVPLAAGLPVAAAILLVTVLTVMLMWRIETEQSRLEDRLAAQERELRATEEVVARSQRREALGRLTGGVAHDFNNLLSVVIGSLDLLGLRTADDGEAEELRNNALQAAERGARLTQRLLTLGRQAALRPEVFDVAELIRGSRVILRATVPESIELRIDLAAEPIRVRADRTQFEAALLNLVINARDAMQDGGTLTISESRVVLPSGEPDHPELPDGEYAVLAVTDEGHGMSEEVLAAAVDPFFTTKEAGAGSGLGLSTVLGFARQSGGDLVLESSEGEGTRVRLFLPAIGDGEEVGGNEGDDEAVSMDAVHVLVVEDEDGVRRVIRRQLEDAGFRVSTARDGDRAVEMLESDVRPDIVLSDVVMPGRRNGGDVARHARAAGIPVILMSGYPRGLEDAGLPADVPLLPKPFRLGDLRRSIAEELSGA